MPAAMKVGDNPPPTQYILLTFLYFLLLLFVWIFDVILHRFNDRLYE